MAGGEAQLSTAVVVKKDNMAPSTCCESVFTVWSGEWNDDLFNDEGLKVRRRKEEDEGIDFGLYRLFRNKRRKRPRKRVTCSRKRQLRG